MLDTATIRTIVGIAGNAISCSLFLSPIPTIVSICKQKAVQSFKPDPYVATVLNCMLWTFYGLPFVTSDNLLVITINGFGLVVELVYVVIFFIYSSWSKRRRIIFALIVEVIFVAIVVFITLNVFQTTKNRSMIVGIICIIFNIIMYASPLTVMRMVFKTKSVKYMPFTLSLANFLNGCVWVVYAVLKFDLYILVPNALGTFSGLVQLVLYATYYKSTSWDDDDGNKAPEVQLSNV